MSKLFFDKKDYGTFLEIPPLVICIWSPYGRDTAQLSWQIAQETARFTNVLLAELPCLGIPRLGLLTQSMDRERNTDTLILELEKKKQINMDYVHRASDTLSLLTANIYGIPDHPVSIRVELETLIKFPGLLIKEARRNGFNTIIFELQGQLATPMTFFALKKADKILIPVDKPEETAFALINIKRMLEVFYYQTEKLLVLTKEDIEAVKAAMSVQIKSRIVNLEVLEANPSRICTYLAQGLSSTEKHFKFAEFFPFHRVSRTKDKKDLGLIKIDNQGEEVHPDLKIHL